ncbi:MAG: hypothetical protein M1814_000985 [Vezdaea aestivalis]|nr:MAG: hypothetical protein M1814_000985 [Vezdaea aestivalis]
MDAVPFLQKNQLCHILQVNIEDGARKLQTIGSPFPGPGSTQKGVADTDHLPGEPRMLLNDPQMGHYLHQEFATLELDTIAPYMGWIASQDSSHISSLTKQIVRGRQIVLTEEPRLHLVWYYDRVFIKPLPEYLLSHAFWDYFIIPKGSPMQEGSMLRAVCGFVRSYLYLIRHASDFALATKENHRLIPRGIEYPEFVRFMRGFESITDEDVTPRWHFGELRLSRLNLAAKIVLRKFGYSKTHGQYQAKFAQSYGPVLFIFAIFSIVLSAMQVAVTVSPLDKAKSSWITFAYVSRIFAVVTIICVVCIGIAFAVLLALMLSREAIFALKAYINKRALKKQSQSGGNLSTVSQKA